MRLELGFRTQLFICTVFFGTLLYDCVVGFPERPLPSCECRDNQERGRVERVCWGAP